MKVIKKKNASFGKKLACKGSGFGEGVGGCGALLQVVPADISNNLSTGGDAHWFWCPLCGAKTFVSYNTFK